jgi:hypothetical protein
MMASHHANRERRPIVIFADGTLGLIFLFLWIFCIIDVITTDAASVRNLPKLAWLAIVIILPEVGSIAWLVAGRRWDGQTTRNLPYRGGYGTGSGYGRGSASVRTSNPDDDEDFQALLRKRAADQRRRAADTGKPENGPRTDDPAPDAGPTV